jgi:hypothetical protein
MNLHHLLTPLLEKAMLAVGVRGLGLAFLILQLIHLLLKTGQPWAPAFAA